MRRPLESLDVTASPDLLRLAEEVERSGLARILKRGDRELALIAPVAPPASSAKQARRRRPTRVERDSILNIIGIGESAEPTDIARHKQAYLAAVFAPDNKKDG
jgi:hypothetical protein